MNNICAFSLSGWKTTLSAGYRQYLDKNRVGDPIIAFKNRFGKSRSVDIQLHYLIHVEQEIKIIQSFYW